jgi:hypothetical protein
MDDRVGIPPTLKRVKVKNAGRKSGEKKFAIDPDTYYYWVQVDDVTESP